MHGVKWREELQQRFPRANVDAVLDDEMVSYLIARRKHTDDNPEFRSQSVLFAELCMFDIGELKHVKEHTVISHASAPM